MDCTGYSLDLFIVSQCNYGITDCNNRIKTHIKPGCTTNNRFQDHLINYNERNAYAVLTNDGAAQSVHTNVLCMTTIYARQHLRTTTMEMPKHELFTAIPALCL